VNEPKIDLVKPEGFTINLPFVGAPVTVRTECDEVVVLMRFTLRPGDNVMNIDFDVTTRRDSTPVARLHENAASDFSRYWRANLSV
jgi:hypothetical protein